jgi:putative ABC transport system permease protein
MMFWRILGELFRASRGRLAVALLAIASGAAVTTALLNLNWDAERKVSAEFRTLGANIIFKPQLSGQVGINDVPDFHTKTGDPPVAGDDPLVPPQLSEFMLTRITRALNSDQAAIAPYSYVVEAVSAGQNNLSVILAGTWLDQMPRLAPWWKINGQTVTDRTDVERCYVGRNVARQLNVEPGSRIELSYIESNANLKITLTVAAVIDSGGQEDNQIIANLALVQKLAGQEGRFGLAQASVPGTPQEVAAVLKRMSAALPDLDVRPVPQIAQAEGRLLPRIRGLIFFMVALILVLTTLCVFASMAALAMERRRDVGLMKAMGGSMSRIVRIFLTEAGALGLAGALIGYVAGIFLSRWIGEHAFHVAISARPEVLPLVIALMVGVALAGALPLRLLGNIRPAEILRGE